MALHETGVHIRVRGKDFGFHSECADTFLSAVGYDPLDDDSPVVPIGPLFAAPDAWECGLKNCTAQKSS